jgi:hypothetical protein
MTLIKILFQSGPKEMEKKKKKKHVQIIKKKEKRKGKGLHYNDQKSGMKAGIYIVLEGPQIIKWQKIF